MAETGSIHMLSDHNVDLLDIEDDFHGLSSYALSWRPCKGDSLIYLIKDKQLNNMEKELERGNFPDSLLWMVFHFECLSKKSVDEGFRMPKRGQHETSILTWAVDRNGHPRIKGTLLSSGMSKMTKSIGKTNLPILTSTLAAMLLVALWFYRPIQWSS
ncbi:hypothetical protein Tco_1391607 [Tanacetum coccineum]